MVKRILIFLVIIGLGVGLYFGLKLVQESQDLRKSAADESIFAIISPEDGTEVETMGVGDTFLVSLSVGLSETQSIGFMSIRIGYSGGKLEVVDQSSVTKNAIFNSPVGDVIINNDEGYVDILASVAGNELVKTSAEDVLKNLININFRVKALGNATVYVDKEFDQFLVGGVNGEYNFGADEISATYSLVLACPANMEKNTDGDCVCEGFHVDCDGVTSNGCETAGLCKRCMQNSDCSICGTGCASAVPAYMDCGDAGLIGNTFVCKCVSSSCELVPLNECPTNMHKESNVCVCDVGYSNLDNISANGCEEDCEEGTMYVNGECISVSLDQMTCLANMERNSKGVCVCKAGFYSCNSDPLDGCESSTVCGSGPIECDNNKEDVNGVCTCIEPGGDYDGNGYFEIADLIGWYGAYRSVYDEEADFDCSGTIDVQDLIEWYGSYRTPPIPNGEPL